MAIWVITYDERYQDNCQDTESDDYWDIGVPQDLK